MEFVGRLALCVIITLAVSVGCALMPVYVPD